MSDPLISREEALRILEEGIPGVSPAGVLAAVVEALRPEKTRHVVKSFEDQYIDILRDKLNQWSDVRAEAVMILESVELRDEPMSDRIVQVIRLLKQAPWGPW